jgi:sialate O-acetylesterase
MQLKPLASRLTLALVFACSLAARAELRLPEVFSDNMVLQQGMPVPVWGWADDGEAVTIKFRRQKITVKAVNLGWRAELRALKSGGPEVLSVSSGKQTFQFTNVLVGEVWVCSGQSNMEWPLSAAYQSQADVAAATNGQIRLFKVPKNRLESPTVRIKSAWETLSPRSAEGFSAVGYYFGRALQEARKVPVGLIGTYWGGTPAETWMDRASLELNPRYQAEILDPFAAASRNWRQATDTYEREKAAAAAAGKPFNKNAPWQPWGGYELYNGMINPLPPFAIKGAIWYQGESNAGRAHQYRSLFPDMIRCWRRNWGEPDFTFLCVQLAPFKPIKPDPAESDWAELREAQLLATRTLPNVGMAVITDVGEERDIHPRKKQPVGARLALAARALAYGEKIEYSGPAFKSLVVTGDKAILTFDHVGGGLEARDGELKGFAVCGPDQKFVWAKAEIRGDKVVVSSPEVPQPIAVRYGWADFPVVNLWNKAGLPASPFRTDDFPMLTGPRP